MDYLIGGYTDIGISKPTNQDSMLIKKASSVRGNVTLAVVCDGLGGLAKGEVASAELVHAFSEWFDKCLPKILEDGLKDYEIREQWEELIRIENEKVRQYGMQCGVNMGTTAAVLLLTEQRYYILNVGDSRVYELTDRLDQLTTDQSLVEREVREGKLTPQEARVDTRRNVLLQCIGVREKVYPDMYFGTTHAGAVYILSSDGFVHELEEQEIARALDPKTMFSKDMVEEQLKALIELNKQRQEQDNISALAIKAISVQDETRDLSEEIFEETQKLEGSIAYREEDGAPCVPFRIIDERMWIHTKERMGV